ncbi:TPA: hypothetical protein NJ322_004300 [Vibrio parahaemolyticus]|nr:hypothetical protein [Vibrio parahaemolyticus]
MDEKGKKMLMDAINQFKEDVAPIFNKPTQVMKSLELKTVTLDKDEANTLIIRGSGFEAYGELDECEVCLAIVESHEREAYQIEVNDRFFIEVQNLDELMQVSDYIGLSIMDKR